MQHRARAGQHHSAGDYALAVINLSIFPCTQAQKEALPPSRAFRNGAKKTLIFFSS